MCLQPIDINGGPPHSKLLSGEDCYQLPSPGPGLGLEVAPLHAINCLRLDVTFTHDPRLSLSEHLPLLSGRKHLSLDTNWKGLVTPTTSWQVYEMLAELLWLEGVPGRKLRGAPCSVKV